MMKTVLRPTRSNGQEVLYEAEVLERVERGGAWVSRWRGTVWARDPLEADDRAFAKYEATKGAPA